MLVHVLLVATLATLSLCAIPPGYTEYKGLGYYKLYTTPKPWSVAWKTCKNEGSNLLVINSQREADAVVNLYAKYPNIIAGAWIGVHDMFFENDFITTLGYPLQLAGFTRWQRGQPNNGNGNENCVLMNRSGTFNDYNCAISLPFFCEA